MAAFLEATERNEENMTGQPTPPNVPPTPEIRPYDQGLLTIGFP